MRPPAEQVVRDYLNRLSVVARSRLQPEDRRAFLARTRDYIERQSGVREMTDPADVMRVLNDYGEPEALVERERARLEARRSERERTAAASKAGFWKPRPPGGARGRDGDDDGAPPSPYSHLTRKDGRPVAGEIKKPASRPISSRWRPGAPMKPPKARQGRVPPPPPGNSPPERNGAAASGPAAAGPDSTGPGSSRPDGTGPGGTGPGSTGPGGTEPGSARAAGAGSGSETPPAAGRRRPAGPGSAAPASGEAPPAPPQVVLNGVVVGTGEGAAPDSGAAAAGDDGAAAAGDDGAPTRRLRRPQLPRRPQFRRPERPRRLQPGDITRAREVARRATDAGRQHRAEAISVALLALGGLIIPFPIWVVGFLLWLIGALIAVFSSVWSLPDKWLGVIGPLALVIIGTATIVSLGGTRSSASGYVNEALTAAMYLFKIGAVLGAGYLAWRLQRGRPSPQVPPWLRRRHI